MDEKITVEKISEIYVLRKGNYKIYAEKEEGRLSLDTCGKSNFFNFIDSKPETLKAIGELMIIASEL
jgi:CRP-like cAMP-binding protein